MIATVKNIVPLILYMVSIVFIVRALIGKTEWSLLYLIGILPLRNVIDRLHVYPLGKDITDVLLIALLVGTFIKGLETKKNVLTKSPINPCYIILVLYTFISLLQGSDYLSSYSLFDLMDPRVQTWKNFCVLPMLFFLTLNNFKEKKWIWRTVVVMCLSMVLMDYYLIRQISWYSNIISRTKINATFVFLGPNEVAAFYNQYTIILLSLLFAMKRGIKKAALLAIVMANLYCVLFLFSRAAYIALIVGLFFLFAVKNKKLLILLIFVVVFWQTALPQKVKDRINMTTNEYGELDESSELRLVVWQRSLELFSENPITGVGYGVFSEMEFELGDTHNIYLKTLAEQGIVGIIIFLLLLFILFLRGIKLFTSGADNLEKGLGLGFAFAIIVLMVNNVFGDRWTYPEVSSNFWIFAALVERFNIISDEVREEKEKLSINKVI